MTNTSVASKLAEISQPDACPPQWLPVLLASSSRHVDSPAPRFNEEDVPFEGNDEALSMKGRRNDVADPDCGSDENQLAVWECHKKCFVHYNRVTRKFTQPDHNNCKANCPTLLDFCPPPPPSFIEPDAAPPSPPSPPPPSPSPQP
eukprot:scaffold127342_cov39-Phaeocystis_antarctica.AAC.2